MSTKDTEEYEGIQLLGGEGHPHPRIKYGAGSNLPPSRAERGMY